MKIFANKNQEHKQLNKSDVANVVEMTAVLDAEEVDEVLNKLLADFKHTSIITNSIIDSLIVNYIKLMITDKLIETKDIVSDVIYRIDVTAKSYSFIMMVSRHGKVDEVFF